MDAFSFFCAKGRIQDLMFTRQMLPHSYMLALAFVFYVFIVLSFDIYIYHILWDFLKDLSAFEGILAYWSVKSDLQFQFKLYTYLWSS